MLIVIVLLIVEVTMKRCSKCGKEKDIGSFYESVYSSDGRRSECIDCTKSNSAKWREKKRGDGRIGKPSDCNSEVPKEGRGSSPRLPTKSNVIYEGSAPPYYIEGHKDEPNYEGFDDGW